MANKKDLAPAAKRQIARIQDYKRLFKSDDGRKVLRDLFKNFSMLDGTFAPNRGELELAYLEGQRSVVLHILSRLNIDADELQTHMTEAINEKPLFAIS